MVEKNIPKAYASILKVLCTNEIDFSKLQLYNNSAHFRSK